MLMRIMAVTGSALIGVLIGLAILMGPSFSNDVHVDTADMVQATSLDELISKAPLIVFGEIEQVVRHFEFAGYDADGRTIEPNGEASKENSAPGMPTTDFSIKVEQALRDDGTIAKGTPIVLRLVGVSENDLRILKSMDKDYVGRNHLFLLTPNPDGQTYGFYFGPQSQLVVEGNDLRVSDNARSRLQLGSDSKPVTLEQFKQHLKTNITN